MQDEQQGASVPEDFEAFEQWSRDKAAPAAKDDAPEPEPAPESDPDKPTQEEDGEKEPAVKGVQKRIDELTKARREAERENADLKRQLAENQGSRPAKEDAPAKPTDPGKPKLEDFPTLEAYQEALTDYKIDQREKAKAAEAEASKAKEAATSAQKDWDDRETAFKAEHADYDAAIDSVEIPKGSPAFGVLSKAVFSAGPELLYQLAKQPDEVKRIAALDPIEAVMALGEFKARLKSPEKPQPKVSSAPKPPARVTGTAQTAKSVGDPDLSFEDHERLMAARDRRR